MNTNYGRNAKNEVLYTHLLSKHLCAKNTCVQKWSLISIVIVLQSANLFGSRWVPIGNVLTVEGVRSNSPLIEAFQNFPTPEDLSAMCRLLGLSFYYSSFSPGFAKIAHPLHGLTCKHHLLGSFDCEVVFSALTSKLITLPMLVYHFQEPGYHNWNRGYHNWNRCLSSLVGSHYFAEAGRRHDALYSTWQQS